MATGKRRQLRELSDLDSIAPAAGSYVGPTPPNGLYRVRLTKLSLSTDRNDDDRFRASMVISHDADAPKAKFNGAFADWSSSVNDVGKPHIRAFADAFGFTAKEMANPLMADDDETVVKLGNKAIGGQMARVGLKKRTYTKNDGSRGESLEAKSCAADTGELDDDPVGEAEEEDEYEETDEYDADTYTGDEEDEAEEDEDETEDEEGEEDEYSDDEDEAEEEEPAPRARKAVKAPPARPAAKTAAKRAPAKATARTGRKPF